jgi:type IV secretory pathway TraG/TraD family ATPase VirD4
MTAIALWKLLIIMGFYTLVNRKVVAISVLSYPLYAQGLANWRNASVTREGGKTYGTNRYCPIRDTKAAWRTGEDGRREVTTVTGRAGHGVDHGIS